MRILGMVALACALVPGWSATAEARSPLKKMQRCLEFKDMTPLRLGCYDAIVPPRTTPEPVPVKVVHDCRFLKDDDERLICFNRFIENPAKTVVSAEPAKPRTLKNIRPNLNWEKQSRAPPELRLKKKKKKKLRDAED